MTAHLQNKFFIILLSFFITSTSAIFSQGKLTDFVIKKVNVEFINTPEYKFDGTQRRASTAAKWMEIETEFESKPDFTEELTFTYYVQINKNVFTDAVTHVDIAGGKELFSVMYISPRSLSRIMDGKNITPNAIEKVSVVISRQGAIVGYGSWKAEKQGWWESLPKKEGFLRNKSETPFAPLYWDRYEAIKTNSR